MIALWLALLSCACAFYLPGVAPLEYKIGQNVTIKVNSIKSTKTAMPYDYYSLPFCRPDPQDKGSKKIKSDPENLGEILWGDAIKPSRFIAQMRINVSCQKICKTTVQRDNKGRLRSMKKLKQRIEDEYRGHLILDNLPVSEVFIWEKGQDDSFFYRRGYPLGIPANGSNPTFVNNHLAFTIKWHKPQGIQTEGFRIVGFNVMPYSVENSYIEANCDPNKEWEPWTSKPQQIIAWDKKDRAKAQKTKTNLAPETENLSWSYSVKWEEDVYVAWVSRWDHYLKSADSADAKIHWFSIINSLLVVLFLSAMTASILLRALHKDFNRYNNPDNEYEPQEETGWKLVHADVFREPPYNNLLACYIGAGSQLLGMAIVTIIFACFGFLSPANRGSLMTAMLLLFVMMSFVSGFVCAQLAKMWHEISWRTIILCATFIPGKIFTVFFGINVILWSMRAATGVPFLTLLALFGLWFLVSFPLVLAGALLGFKRKIIELPLEANQVNRFIPAQPWFLQPWVVYPLGGLIPFMASFIELSFIMSSLWLNKFYYVFGFVAIVFVILIVTCAETAIVGTYFQLCFEDYRWWWHSFLLTASCGGVTFLYSVYYFFSALSIRKFWSVLVYFAYMLIISYLFGIMTGAIGFLAAFAFVYKIYSILKVD